MKKLLFYAICSSFVFVACDNLNQKTKDTINKTGETVGKTTSVFVDGVKDGIDKTFACEIVLSEALVKAGVKTGKYSIESEQEATDNKLILYVIFDADCNKNVQAKVLDENGAEYGRAKAVFKGKKGDAVFVDFIFDKRTNLEGNSKILIDGI